MHIYRTSIEAQELISDCIINKYDSLSHCKYPQPVVHQEGVGLEIMSPIHAGILAGLVLCRPFLGNHSCWEFRIVRDMFYLEDIIPVFPFL